MYVLIVHCIMYTQIDKLLCLNSNLKYHLMVDIVLIIYLYNFTE